MDTLPTDILLNITEYGVPRRRERYSDIGLSTIDIVDRIQQYDPSFNYREWKQKRDSKDRLREYLYNSPMYELYKYLQNPIFGERSFDNSIYLVEDVTLGAEEMIEIQENIAAILRSPSSVKIDIPNRRFVIADEINFQRDLDIIERFENPQKKYFIYIDSPCRYIYEDDAPEDTYLHYIADIAGTPDTLEEVLVYVVERYRNLQSVYTLPSLPLYEYLGPNSWQIDIDESNNNDILQFSFNPNTNITYEGILDHIPAKYRGYTDIEYIGNDILYLILTYPPEIRDEFYNELFFINSVLYPLRMSYCSE